MMKRRDNRVNFYLSNGEKVFFEPGQTVLEALIEADIEIGNVCGGMGSCGTCRVFIEKGADSIFERNEIELERAHDLSFADNERQACQIAANSNLVIRTP